MFLLKGAVITSHFLSSFAGERGVAGGGRVRRQKVPEPGSSDRRGYMGRAKGEAESVLVAIFSYDINDFKQFLADFRQRNRYIFLPFLEASRYPSKHPIQSV